MLVIADCSIWMIYHLERLQLGNDLVSADHVHIFGSLFGPGAPPAFYSLLDCIAAPEKIQFVAECRWSLCLRGFCLLAVCLFCLFAVCLVVFVVTDGQSGDRTFESTNGSKSVPHARSDERVVKSIGAIPAPRKKKECIFAIFQRILITSLSLQSFSSPLL